MITRTSPADLNLQNTMFQDMEKTGLLFFDIETTGLSARASYVYLIGTISFQDGFWTAIQWFAESPEEEAEVIQTFLNFASSFSQLIHFNGQRFDLPYLEEKCALYHIPFTLHALISRDLYRMLRPLRSLLGLRSMKQKHLEEYLGLFREDLYSGGELISVYKNYVHQPEEEAFHMLLLHNYEDLLGMLSLLPMLSYRTFLEASYQVADAEQLNDTIILRGWLPYPLPKPLSFRNDFFYLSAEQTRFAVQIFGAQTTLKHFFPDYKNYFYLPLEDTAMHKSVAAYVDKEFREPAKASTCYNKKEGFYLPQFESLFKPIFKDQYTDTLEFFPCTNQFLSDRQSLQRYLVHLLEHLQ